MASLLDTVRQNSAAMTQTGTPTAAATGLNPTTGESTEQTQGLMSTAQTGKDLGPQQGGTARLSAVGEKLASLNTLIGAQAIQRQGAMQSASQEQQSAGMEQQQQASLAQATQQSVDMQTEFNTKVKGMMQDQRLNLQQVDLNKDKARLEQLGVQLRLGNQEYIDKLQTEATKSRLDDATRFNEALQQSVFSDEESLFSSSLEFRSLIKADDREATKQLAAMDINFAIQVAQAQNANANAQMMWSGIGTAGGAGVSAAAGAMGGPAAVEAPPEGNSVMQSAQNQPAPNYGTSSTYNPTEGVPTIANNTPSYTPPGG